MQIISLIKYFFKKFFKKAPVDKKSVEVEVNVSTKRIYSANTKVLNFTSECEKLGYMNNASLNAMRFDWCNNNGGAWFATFKDNKIISISGIHPFEDGYRALFRGAQLEKRPCGLNKYHMQSYCFADQLPLQIKYAGPKPIYITTNIENDRSGHMNRVDKLFHKLAHYEIVEWVKQMEIYDVQQNVWKLNVRNYNCARFGSPTP